MCCYFKQKTSYGMRNSDWSSDVCSSDLRHRLARDQRLVDRSAAFEDDAIGRDFFARADTQHVANSDVLERDLLVAPVAADAPGELGREVEERTDRSARRLARPEFEHLPEQHPHRDARGGLEIALHHAVGRTPGRREECRGGPP